VLEANRIVVRGVVTANGQDGPAAEFDASGGGAGGGIGLYAQRVEVAGRVTAAGGPGGDAFELGGSGGGGRIKVGMARGVIAPGALDASGGLGPCPGDRASHYACDGTIHIGRALSPVYLPAAQHGICTREPRRAIVLAIDTSSSMGGATRGGRPAIEAAIEAADDFLSRLGPHDRSGLVAFADAARLVQPLTDRTADTRAALGGLELAVGSRLDLGIATARDALEAAHPSEARILVMLTDGLPSVDPSAVLTGSDAARRAGIRIYALGIGAAVDRGLLERVTGSAGRVLLVEDAEELGALYAVVEAREGCPSPGG
jgi:hypothetical protein